MTLVFLICLAWRMDGVCVADKTVPVSVRNWSDLSCMDLAHPAFRPNVLACIKIREADL